jgi:hypothetical protein
VVCSSLGGRLRRGLVASGQDEHARVVRDKHWPLANAYWCVLEHNKQ